jgi:hypothetical protein
MADTKPKTDPEKRRKPEALRKGDFVRIRLTLAQKETLTAAAQRDGLGLSTWLLMLGMREAQKTAGPAGAAAPSAGS